MAQVVYMGVQTAHALSGVSNRLMLTSVELAVHAAATALRAIRSSPDDPQKNLAENPHVKDELEAMDIEAKLKTVHALVLTIQKQRSKAGIASAAPSEEAARKPEATDESDVIGVCLDQVKEVLDSITSTVNALNEELETHKERWFASWRTPDLAHHLVALKAKVIILDKRLDMLLKVRSFLADHPTAAPPDPAAGLPVRNQYSSYSTSY